MDWRCRKFKGSWKFWNLEMVCRQVSCNEFFNLYFVIWSISLPGLMFWRNINHVYYLFMQKLLHLCAFVSISWSVLCPEEVYLIQGRTITCNASCLDPSKMTHLSRIISYFDVLLKIQITKLSIWNGLNNITICTKLKLLVFWAILSSFTYLFNQLYSSCLLVCCVSRRVNLIQGRTITWDAQCLDPSIMMTVLSM